MIVLMAIVASIAGANKLDSNNILVDNSGEAVLLTYAEALKACPVGTHLPTAREWAEDAKAYGAEGILELAQVQNEKDLSYGYVKIRALNPDGSKEKFYYSFVGLKREKAAIWKNAFWTSSVIDDGSGFVGPIGIYGAHGDMFGYDGNAVAGVRCF